MKNSLSWKNIANFKVESVFEHIVAIIIVGAASQVAGWLFSLSIVTQVIIFTIGILVLFFILKFRRNDNIKPFGREEQVKELVENIKAKKSSLVVGIFAAERTEIVDYLRDESNKDALYGKQANQLIFSYLDLDTQERNLSYSEFWEKVLIPVYQKMTDDEKAIYDNDKQTGFDESSLEKLFQQITKKGQRLIVMIDRFHQIVRFKELNTPRFFKNLRSWSLHKDSPLNLILTLGGYRQLYSLNTKTSGKLYDFNEMRKVTLSSFSNESELEGFLKKIGLSKGLCQQIKDYGITHPRLLAEMIGTAKEANSLQRLFFPLKKLKTEEIGQQVLNILSSSDYRYLCEATFSILENKMEDVNFNGLDDLEEQGFIRKSNGQWQICSVLIDEFLRDKLLRTGQPCASGKVE